MSMGYIEIDGIIGPVELFSKEAIEKYRQQVIVNALKRQEEIMAESESTKKLVKLIKDLDKLSQVAQTLIKDAKAFMPAEKPKDEPDK